MPACGSSSSIFSQTNAPSRTNTGLHQPLTIYDFTDEGSSVQLHMSQSGWYHKAIRPLSTLGRSRLLHSLRVQINMYETKQYNDIPLLLQEPAHGESGTSLDATSTENLECKLQPGPCKRAAMQRNREIRIALIVSTLSSLSTALFLVILWFFCWQGASKIHVTSGSFKYDQFYSVDSPHAIGCGTSVQEAIALDCQFDELSDLWLPRRCSRKYEHEYLQSNNGGPFIYWTAPDGETVVTNRSEYAGGSTYYSTTRDHLRHCEYNLYRFADSLVTGELVGHSEGFGPHLHHCATILGRYANLAPDIDQIDVDTVSTFGYC